MEELKSTKLFGIKITTESEEKILEYIVENLSNKNKKLFITTPNPEIIMYARNHPEFRKIMNEADLALPDGVGVSLALRLMGRGRIPRVTGAEMLEKVCGRLAKSTNSVGFFGGYGDVAKVTSECLQKKYSGLKVAYANEGWNEAMIQGKHIDFLFVAMGFPKQEEWIYENLKKTPVEVAMGVGGVFDFISGKVPRSPKLLRRAGFEWLFRLIVQPWRVKRQLALISFMLLVFKGIFLSRIIREKI
jgi:N-acetylglucosaminyldiphosphoundecaprenol N-acetyl-beta-D-mannosaminyltransferase